MKDLQKLWKSEFEYCEGDLEYFVSNYCRFEDRDSEGIVVPFKPWEAQKAALKSLSENRLNLFLKARQVGISWLALFYCAHEMIYRPGSSVLAISKNREDANELVRRLGVIFSEMPHFLSAGGAIAKVKKESVSLTRGGRESVFRSMPCTKSSGRSLTASILILDEWAFQENAKELWTSVFPTVNRPCGGKVIGISTAKRGTLFEELWEKGIGWSKSFISVFADPRRDEGFLARTEAQIGALVKCEYPRTPEEAFAQPGGRFFPEFNPESMVCAPFAIPGDYRVYTAMDYGLDMLAHYRIALDSRGNVYVFDEIYESGLVVSEAADRIIASDRCSYSSSYPYARLAPPDLFARSAYSGKSEADGFLEKGIRLVRSSNNRTAGWLYLKELMKPLKQPDGSYAPRLRIFSTCPNLIRTLSSLLADKNAPGDAARTPHELTHAPDALRYFAVYHYSAGQGEAMPSACCRFEDVREDYLRFIGK